MRNASVTVRNIVRNMRNIVHRMRHIRSHWSHIRVTMWRFSSKTVQIMAYAIKICAS